MLKNIIASGLTLASVILVTATSTHAELAPDINALTIKRIQRAQPQQNNPSNRQAANQARSMEYVKLGWAAQKKGQDRQAIIYYDKAIKLDDTNPYAFMASATLFGNTPDGVTCMKAALYLFQQQNDREGYDIAMGWLRQYDAID
ncbi:tetratricopeptide repeat protein [Chamaesiphon sp. GL140_3_metabinner_50]|uniref:tetratricopeptide repeat protein n=1 Tax=Chamaesiphon sp. GL140_3_metabinner_50 TaxID=2970812 RepID=UPI0025D0177F|nr:tetratricopeptide repeat protein [Chamaesiphon sp. GL140_3_metabinner_50]